MAFDKFSLGSKKNIKKEINVDVKPKHIVWFFLVLMLIVVLVVNFLSSNFIGVDELSLKCSNDTVEVITYNKTVYCGEHYSVLRDSLNEKQFNYIEKVILNGE